MQLHETWSLMRSSMLDVTSHICSTFCEIKRIFFNDICSDHTVLWQILIEKSWFLMDLGEMQAVANTPTGKLIVRRCFSLDFCGPKWDEFV